MGDNMNNEEMGYPGQRFSAGSGSSSMDPFAPNPAALQYVPNEFGITHSETSPMYRYNNPAEPDSGAAIIRDSSTVRIISMARTRCMVRIHSMDRTRCMDRVSHMARATIRRL